VKLIHQILRLALNRLFSKVLLSALTLVTLGCSYGIGVRPAAGPRLFDAWRDSAAEADELSPRTQQTLRRWDLDQLYAHHPAEAYARLQQLAAADPQPDTLFALAEISFVLGYQTEERHNLQAGLYYYLCAGYAYHFLFDDPDEAVHTFDPRFRLACDLYNNALAKCIRHAQRCGRLDPRQHLHLCDGEGFDLSVVHHGFPWPPSDFGPLLFCADYQVVGLANQYRGYGLGVALIGTRVPNPEGGSAPNHAFYPREVSFPATAFFRFGGSVADLTAQRSGRLELFNPLTIQTIAVNGRAVPLETDLTTPLAYFLSRTDLEGIEYTGFLNADKIQKRAGIYMFEPYQPGKIPVLMVHGLLASPLTWTPMFNDLRSDPTLRKHFQFWFYLYPTGNPYLATAADLRRSLTQLRAELDPDKRDPALDEMVLVGHSMGGLVSRLLTADSADDFWSLVSPQPFASLKATPGTRTELESIFFFERQPYIRRIVFIGTPHHGSDLSPSVPARLAVKLVHLPRNLIRAARDVAKENPEIGTVLGSGSLPTSVDLLAPHAPALELLAQRPKPTSVYYHSIIGDITGMGPKGTDGVVPVASAHLDQADSEILVPAGHTTVHHHPRAVLEVWRILLDHMHEVHGDKGERAPRFLLPMNAPNHLRTSRDNDHRSRTCLQPFGGTPLVDGDLQHALAGE
jgi:pimeloyl-ACP methyl ester carboxylesterase